MDTGEVIKIFIPGTTALGIFDGIVRIAAGNFITTIRHINSELTTVMNKIVGSTADLISAESDQMVADAWRNSVIYSIVMVTVLAFVLIMSRMVIVLLRALLGGLAATMEALCNRKLDITVPSEG